MNNFIDAIKRLMHSEDMSHDVAFELNHIIYLYDADRAKNEIEQQLAGKEWEYRLKKLCDYRARRVTLETNNSEK